MVFCFTDLLQSLELLRHRVRPVQSERQGVQTGQWDEPRFYQPLPGLHLLLHNKSLNRKRLRPSSHHPVHHQDLRCVSFKIRAQNWDVYWVRVRSDRRSFLQSEASISSCFLGVFLQRSSSVCSDCFSLDSTRIQSFSIRSPNPLDPDWILIHSLQDSFQNCSGFLSSVRCFKEATLNTSIVCDFNPHADGKFLCLKSTLLAKQLQRILWRVFIFSFKKASSKSVCDVRAYVDLDYTGGPVWSHVVLFWLHGLATKLQKCSVDEETLHQNEGGDKDLMFVLVDCSRHRQMIWSHFRRNVSISRTQTVFCHFSSTCDSSKTHQSDDLKRKRDTRKPGEAGFICM